MDGVVLQEIGEVANIGQVIHRDDVNFRQAEGAAQHHTADAAKAIDPNPV